MARASLGHVGVQASELQLAALLSLQSFKADYHLWATYALRASPVKAEHPSVAGGEAARAHWRLAKDAVMAVLNRGKIHAGNITLMLQHAREYKRSYYLMLLGLYGAKDFNPKREKAAVREHRSRLRTTDAALHEDLQRTEDELPAGTLAWCRLIARQNAVRKVKERGGGAAMDGGIDDSAALLDDSAAIDDESAEVVLQKKKAMDLRVEEAPSGYIHRVNVVDVKQFSLRLFRTQTAAEMAASIGTGAPSAPPMLTVRMSGIDVRTRLIKDVGSSLHFAMREMDVMGSAAAVLNSGSSLARSGGAPPPPPPPLLCRISGDPSVRTPDAELGSHPDHPGSSPTFVAFLAARRQQQRNRDTANCLQDTASGLFGGERKRSSLAVQAPAPAPEPVGGNAVGGSAVGGSAVGGSAVGGSAPLVPASAALAPPPASGTIPPVAASGGGVRAARAMDLLNHHHHPTTISSSSSSSASSSSPPAISVFHLKSSDESRAHEMRLCVQPVEAVYLPLFFAQYDAFMRTLEAEKRSSQLGASAMFRAKFVKLMRSMHSSLAESWHMPEKQLMTAFGSVTSLFDVPSARHMLAVRLSGVKLRLMSERDAADELMTLKLPPLAISSSPRVGHPEPSKQRAEVAFGGVIKVSTPLKEKCSRRVLSVAHAGANEMSRMGGGLVSAVYSLARERSELQEKLRSLSSEVDAIKTTLAAMRFRGAASALGGHGGGHGGGYGGGYAALGERGGGRWATPKQALAFGRLSQVPGSGAGVGHLDDSHHLSTEDPSGGDHEEALTWRELVSQLKGVTRDLEEAKKAAEGSGSRQPHHHDLGSQFESMKKMIAEMSLAHDKKGGGSCLGCCPRSGVKQARVVEVDTPRVYDLPGGGRGGAGETMERT